METQHYYSPQDREKKALKVGKWEVNTKGSMLYDSYYAIPHNRLTEEDWIAHLFEKGWIDWNEFIPAYFQALKNADKEFVKVRVFY